MFHVKHDAEFDNPDIAAAAHTLFGRRVEAAATYRDFLADAGVVRGLIGPREVDQMWSRHVLNCAAAAEAIAADGRVVDIGSGAGLPGIPLALARSDLRVTLVEPLLRRYEFLVEIVGMLGLDVEVVRGRAEDKEVIAAVGGTDVVTSRAVAPLDRLARWSLPLLRPGGELLAIKGSSAGEEIEKHRAALSRAGLGDLRVESFGADTLAVATTVVRGEYRGKPGKRR
ncbi:16S rRNA (guanine(527)-N(7))-methyltransferase RsmG [Williamsia sp. Leaf354]|uniref:16S rRNA (guanine(527)-N(7))-methyltransferase RsmG n=1 Tax=Williamsia sp. Leaf354 TaxID=1736349 RepID=UPI0009E876A4|nr:16S rRNA (guanine(527)-N(7))-methyltransferase RsmG [Williamsia sp. Leaf354]